MGSTALTSGAVTLGNTVFTVTADAAGLVTLDQLRAVVHTPNTGPDQSTTLSGDNLVTLKATITDKDGDTTDATLNIGQNLTFKDDGPSISVTGVESTLTVDETVLATNASASFAANFTSAFGADGAGSITYSLGTAGGASGLVDTATGQAVNLVNNAGVIEGRTAGSNLLVFTVGVNAAGVVTLDQVRAVVHPNAANPDDAKTLSADNLVTLNATITDKDGDTSTATLNIGQNLTFKDDGPTVGAFTDITVANELNAMGTGTNASFLSGADGWQSISVVGPVIAGIHYTYSSTGSGDTLVTTAIGLSDADNSEVFRFVVEADGDTKFTLAQPDAGSTNEISLSGTPASGPTGEYPFGNPPVLVSGDDGNLINVSTTGIGVNNGNFNTNELVYFHLPAAADGISFTFNGSRPRWTSTSATTASTGR